MSIPEIVLIALATVVVLTVGFVALLPWIFAPMIRLLLSPRYGFRVTGRTNVPRRGPVVLAANHVTWIDSLFLAATCGRRGQVLGNANFFKSRFFSALARRAGLIPVPFSGPKAQRAAIVAVREALDRGGLVAIFPEGQLTRNEFLGPFYRGLEVILKGRPDVTVVPVHLDNLWGSIFSFRGGRAFGKRPIGLRRVINIAYGPPLSGPPSLFEIRRGLLDAGVDAVGLRKTPMPAPEGLDPDLGRLDHPDLGLLTGSAANYDRDGVVQPGHRDGAVGLPLPGVALRGMDESGQVLPQNVVGRIQARTVGHPNWTDTGIRGRLDSDGFLTIETDLHPAGQAESVG